MKTKLERIEKIKSLIAKELSQEEPNQEYVQSLKLDLYYLEYKPQARTRAFKDMDVHLKSAMELNEERAKKAAEERKNLKDINGNPYNPNVYEAK